MRKFLIMVLGILIFNFSFSSGWKFHSMNDNVNHITIKGTGMNMDNEYKHISLMKFVFHNNIADNIMLFTTNLNEEFTKEKPKLHAKVDENKSIIFNALLEDNSNISFGSENLNEMKNLIEQMRTGKELEIKILVNDNNHAYKVTLEGFKDHIEKILND